MARSLQRRAEVEYSQALGGIAALERDARGNSLEVVVANSSGGGGLAIGVAIGVALGAAMGNMGAGIAIGVAIGVALGGAQRRKSTTSPDNNHESGEPRV
jgi:hypothetical protein